MKVTLFLDTSLLGLAFALVDESGKLLHKEYSSSKGIASSLFPSLLRKALKSVGCEESHVHKVVVSKGPGSFTGIRIGLSWAMGFCTKASGRELLAVSSLSVLASYLKKKEKVEKPFVLIANTKTSAFYAREEDGQLCLGFYEGWVEPRKGETLFADNFYEKIKDEEACHLLSKEELARLGLEAMVSEVDLEDSSLVCAGAVVEPLYLRKSSVEEKLS